jgi:hypothetical protein
MDFLKKKMKELLDDGKPEKKPEGNSLALQKPFVCLNHDRQAKGPL